MASLVAECLRFLELLVNTYRVTRRAARTLLLEATRDQLMCIAEVVVNTLEGNLTISTRPQQELARFKKVLRKLSCLRHFQLGTMAYQEDVGLWG